MKSNVSTLIQATAQQIRVVSLTPGDVYKRLVEATYGDPKLAIGVVTEVMHNGDRAMIVGVEYSAGFQAVTVDRRVFTDKSDVNFFPATVKEFTDHLADMEAHAAEAVRVAESTLRDRREALATLRDARSRWDDNGLHTAATEPVTAQITD